MKHRFRMKGTCAAEVEFEIERGVLHNVKFINGCAGNTQGIAALAEGRPAKEVAELLMGIDCNGRGTSCPAELARAIAKVT